MSLYAFRLLSPAVQLYWVLKHGTFLATRWEADDDGVNLYHCAGDGRGFFVEVGVDYGPGAAGGASKLCEQRAAGWLQLLREVAGGVSIKKARLAGSAFQTQIILENACISEAACKSATPPTLTDRGCYYQKVRGYLVWYYVRHERFNDEWVSCRTSRRIGLDVE